jgi:hypothetical protein
VSDSTAVDQPFPHHLATSARRVRVATMISKSAVVVDDALLLADALDLVAGALFAVAGVADDPARDILAVLWAPEVAS